MKAERRVLVTGAAGFIGSRLSEKLAERGWSVLGIDNLNDYYDVRLKEARLENLGFSSSDGFRMEKPIVSAKFPRLSFKYADITDLPAMETIFREFAPEVVVNLAAQAGVRHSIEHPFTYVTNNVDGFLVLLECARKWPVRKFVYASSSSVYGGNDKIPFSETDNVDKPVSLYAATKRSNELMARAYGSLYGIPAIGLRFFTVYGPWGRPDMAPMIFARAISRGEALKVFNHGNHSRDFTYIDDIVEGMVNVLENSEEKARHDLYNIGHGSPMQLMDFISMLEEAMGSEAEKEFLPMQKGDVFTTYADTRRLKEDFGYQPSTGLEEGIRKFAQWYNSDKNPLK